MSNRPGKRVALGILTMASLCFINSECFAQRTMQFQKHITADAVTGFTSLSDFGVSIGFGSYLLRSYWKTELMTIPVSLPLSTGDKLSCIQITAAGEYMHRILTVRSRLFSIYTGGGIFLGWEMYDPFKRLPDEIETGLGEGSFLYGIRPRIEAELFFCRKVAFVLGAAVPINFSSPVRKYLITMTAGVRLNL